MIDIYNILDFLKNIFSKIGLTYIFLIGVGLLLLTMIILSIIAEFSLEAKTSRAIIRVQNYLENNPFITNENIVEFNRLMKRIPKTMRTKWQQYVVNRNQAPSKFFNENDCIEKPFKTKGLNLIMSQFKNILAVLTATSFVLSLCTIVTNVNIATVVLNATFVPALLMILGFIYLFALKLKHNNLRTRMFLNFNDMVKLLDRAVTTFPEFVDYEILFTKKEIDAMIPELQEYLRQRAIYEEEQLEKAKQSEVEHGDYDFTSLGIDGSLVMERAMKECEYYLGNRRKILADIEQLQSEKDLLTKSYDEKNKVSQRKLRDINETLDRLREKLNNTTNKIVGNDIRRQQAEEIKKQQNIEREIEEDNNRYNEELKKIDEQINAKHADINSSKNYVEVAFINEFKAYSDKVYEKLHEVANEKVEQSLNDALTENQTLKQQLEERDQFIAEKNSLFQEKIGNLEETAQKIESYEQTISEYETYKDQAENYMSEQEKEIDKKNKEISAITLENENLKKNLEIQEKKYKELRKQKVKEITRYFDVNGNEFYYDDRGLPYYFDENNNKVYYYNSDEDDSDNGALVENNQEIPIVNAEENYNQETPVEELKEDEEQESQSANNELNNLDLLDGDDEDYEFDDEMRQKYENFVNSFDEEDAEDNEIINNQEEKDEEPAIILDEDELNELQDNAIFNDENLEGSENQEEGLNKEESIEQDEENPDEQLQVLKAAIDAEIEKLEQEHNKLQQDMNNVAKEVSSVQQENAEDVNKENEVVKDQTKPEESKTKKTTKKPSTAKTKSTTSRKTTSKKDGVKKSNTNKTKKVDKGSEELKVVEKGEDNKAKKPSTKKTTAKKSTAKKSTSSKPAEKKLDTKANTKSKSTSKNKAEKENTKTTRTSNPRTSKSKVNNDVNIDLEDFGTQLNTALTEVEKESKKTKK